MTDLLGDGKPRVYFLESLPDASAPTPEQLEAGTEVTSLVSELRFTEDVEAGPIDLLTPSREITIRIPVRLSPGFARQVRSIARNVWRLERALDRARRLQPRYVRLSAMRTDYARRRKARGRRR